MKNANSIADRYPSPLRYPGGKSVLAGFLSDILKLNSITGAYCEGYAGGAGAALRLLMDGRVERIILNDADIHIYSFWNSVLNNNDQFLDLVINCEITLSEWYKQKHIYENPSRSSEIELGFATFFLNRTNRGGILPNAGPTGGFDQKSIYKIDARFNIKNLVPRIEKLGRLNDRIDFFNMDALEFVRKIVKEQDKNDTLIYLDPPYFGQGKKLYLNYYSNKDHSDLSTEVAGMTDSYWLVSYDNVDEIRNLYERYRNCSFDINYSVQVPKKGKEIIFFSEKLNLPSQLKIKNFLYEIPCPIK